MRTIHLTDEAVQSYLDSGRFENAEQALHYRKCRACQKIAERYRLLGRWLSAAEPAFSLPPDFTASVAARLPKIRSRGNGFLIAWILLACVGIASALVLFPQFHMVKPFMAVVRMYAPFLRGMVDSFTVFIRSSSPAADPLTRWLGASGLALLFALLMDPLARRFTEVLVDKNR
jgi:hypothetical protein